MQTSAYGLGYASTMPLRGTTTGVAFRGMSAEIALAWGGAASPFGQDEPKSAWARLRSLIRLPGRLGRPPRERTSAEMTTQIAITRGQALRDAHRRLHQHMKAHPGLRQVTPHLYMVERGLRKLGSRALMKLPVPVMRAALDQLALLSHADASPEERDDLHVLRVRLSEAIALRGPRGSRQPSDGNSRQPYDLSSGVDVRDISVDEFQGALGESLSSMLDSVYPDSALPDSRYPSRVQRREYADQLHGTDSRLGRSADRHKDGRREPGGLLPERLLDRRTETAGRGSRRSG